MKSFSTYSKRQSSWELLQGEGTKTGSWRVGWSSGSGEERGWPGGRWGARGKVPSSFFFLIFSFLPKLLDLLPATLPFFSSFLTSASLCFSLPLLSVPFSPFLLRSSCCLISSFQFMIFWSSHLTLPHLPAETKQRQN